MDNETMNQNDPVTVVPEQPIVQTVPTQSYSSKMPYIIVTIVVIIALAFGYVYYSTQVPSASIETPVETSQTPSADQAQTLAPTSGNTTADISAELDQTVNDSSVIDQDAAASLEAVGGF